jgi:hypothetical protein
MMSSGHPPLPPAQRQSSAGGPNISDRDPFLAVLRRFALQAEFVDEVTKKSLPI